jgi:hypothetical protein
MMSIPNGANRLDNSTASSRVQLAPSAAQSLAEIRMANGLLAGHTARTAVTVSNKNRIRFSNEPPIGKGSLQRLNTDTCTHH